MKLRPERRHDLTCDELRSLFHYDPMSGEFTRIACRNSKIIGKKIGKVDAVGYIKITVKGYYQLGHRLAWLYVNGHWPTEQIDHINGNRSDNRISNLRLATGTQNGANRRANKNTSSGLKGVTHTRCGRWQAQTCYRGKRIYIGTFSTPEDAHVAYLSAALQYFGEFASDGRSYGPISSEVMAEWRAKPENGARQA